MDIRIGWTGRILAGNEAGSYLRVRDDAADSGGLLILTSTDPGFGRAFDGWVEDRDALAGYFAESGWTVEWLAPVGDLPNG